MKHFRDASGHDFHCLSEEDYYFLYDPISKLLPDSVSDTEIANTLQRLQDSFKLHMTPEFVAGNVMQPWDLVDYYFPGHPQRIRLMYVYFAELKFFGAKTSQAMVSTLQQVGNSWFIEAEFETTDENEDWGTFFCHKKSFYFLDEFGQRYMRLLANEPVSQIEWTREPLDFPTT